MKPILLDEVAGKVRRLLAYRDLFLENQWLRRELNREHEAEPASSAVAGHEAVFELVRKVAPTRSTVLITGESGTGKELVARAIHRQGAGDGQRFLAVNCAAIPHDLLENQLFGHRKGAFTGADRDQPGVFVHAGDGTVFLDEIAELPPATQAKLLRAIEQKEVHAGRGQRAGAASRRGCWRRRTRTCSARSRPAAPPFLVAFYLLRPTAPPRARKACNSRALAESTIVGVMTQAMRPSATNSH